MTPSTEQVNEFLAAACVPLHNHSSGGIERARALLEAEPELAESCIHAAAVLGNAACVRSWLVREPESATRPGGPHGWDPLTTLCVSRYLRLDRDAQNFVDAARALLDAGADARTGYYAADHQPEPTHESALYGAAGVAHHPELTRLLLERGADPNDDETPYHSPEWFDNRAMEVLVESGRLSADSLTTMLVRKLDWTDLEGVRWLLQHGAPVNHPSPWRGTALHHSLGRDNPLPFLALLMEHGADPTLTDKGGHNAFQLAAAMGRGDVLDLFACNGFAYRLEGVDALRVACARGDEAGARALVAADPTLVARLAAEQPDVVAHFAGAGNTEGTRILLDLGLGLEGLTDLPNARGESALHLAVWRERADTVRLLLARGAPLEATNRAGQTPLAMAVRAQVEGSEWTPHSSTEILEALLEAGAKVDAAPFPSGSDAADALLRRYGRGD
jgi:ankyrin repeat protein